MKKLTFEKSREKVARSAPEEAAGIILRHSWKEAAALVFEHPDPEAVMAAIPAQSAYLLVKQMGEESALDLLELATSAQVQAMFDFECWDKDRLETKPTKMWFRILMAMDHDRFIRHARKMDFTFLVLFCKRHMSVERFEEMLDWDPDTGAETYIPPDRRHIITYMGNRDEVRFIHEFTQRILRMNMEFYYEIIEALYWELPSDLEEWAYQDRIGRMTERGFPDYFSAIEIFSTVNPEKFRPAAKATASGLSSEEFADADRRRFLQLYEPKGDFLRELIARDFPGRDDVVTEIMAVTNMVSVAHRVSVADAEKVRGVVEATNGYLNIGLEHLSGGVPEKGVGILQEKRLLDVFKIGRSLVFRLGSRARKLLGRATTDGKTAERLMVDSPHRGFLAALLPREPENVSEDGNTAPFRSLDEVRAASARLVHWERMIKVLYEDCGLSPEAVSSIPMLGLNHDLAEALTYKPLFSTAYANDALGRPFAPAPIKAADLPRVYERFTFGTDGRRLSDEAERQFLEWLSLRDARDLFFLFEEIFQSLAGELAIARKMRRPDVRYISCLLLEIPY